jgi:uncharacterized protein YjbI with pentapeptide repeats
MAAIGIPIALIAFTVDVVFRFIERGVVAEERAARTVERAAMEEERVAREEGRLGLAWQLLTINAPGNSGKIWAVEFLNSQNVQLIGIDLSPPANAATNVLTYLNFVKAPDSNFDGANLSRVSMREAVFSDGRFKKATLAGADMTGAILEYVAFDNAILTGANFVGANVTSGWFENAELTNAAFAFANVSDANFERSTIEVSSTATVVGPYEQFESVWRWEDTETLDGGHFQALSCPLEDREKHEAGISQTLSGEGDFIVSEEYYISDPGGTYSQIGISYFSFKEGGFEADLNIPPDGCE